MLVVLTQPQPTDYIIIKSNRKGIYRYREHTNDLRELTVNRLSVSFWGDKEFFQVWAGRAIYITSQMYLKSSNYITKMNSFKYMQFIPQ